MSTYTLNFGPQHPSSHGVLRLVLELDGEIVVNIDPHIGFLHRGKEKAIETRTYLQSIPYFDRIDYVAPLIQEHAFVLAIEKLLGAKVPIRAKYIRVLLSEISRIMSHLLFVSAYAMDIGATTPMLWLFEEREKILWFLERVNGSRLHCAYFRPGGVEKDLEDALLDDIEKFSINFHKTLEKIDDLLTENVIFKARSCGVGYISKEDAIDFGLSGPLLRAAGVDFDLRKKQPYEIYNILDFNIPIKNESDCYARYLVRMDEMRESIKIILQCLPMPKGDFLEQNVRHTPPNQLETMEEMIHHFKFFSEGFNVPSGETYQAVESPKGEFGIYLISIGENKAYKCKIRSPGFTALQALNKMGKGQFLADVVAILGSLDVVFGEIDR